MQMLFSSTVDHVGETIGDVSITIGYLTPLEARLWEHTLFEDERVVHEKRLVNEYCKHYTHTVDEWMGIAMCQSEH